jgi:hypothetical protein
MERAYEATVSVRFVVSAEDAGNADDTAATFVSQLAAWIDGSLGSPPFAPWLTAWSEGVPMPLELDGTTWPVRRVTRGELSDGRLWRDNI